jgi:hypothetical protein
MSGFGHVAAPRQFNGSYGFYPATEKQLAFLGKLVAERVVPAELMESIDFEINQPSGPGKSEVSELIEDLMKIPKTVAAVNPTVAAVPDVPAGRYAVTDRMGVLRFVKVDRPTEGRWKGMTFVKLQVSDDFVPMQRDQRDRVLALIASDPAAASKRYGHEIGACGVCGRTLTDEHSRELGIGPVCAAKVGW